jgi:predicted negative regulator of RcsB-dependent stress response
MMKARMQVDNDDFTGAAASLKQALAIDLDDAGLKAITRLRYAQVLLANDELEAALSEAKSDVPISFEASQQELLGDIYQAQNDKEAAINAYNNAWNLISERNEERAVLALKMESLGIYPEPIKAQDSLIQQPAAPQGLTVDNTVMMDNDSDAINENNNSNEPE